MKMFDSNRPVQVQKSNKDYSKNSEESKHNLLLYVISAEVNKIAKGSAVA